MSAAFSVPPRLQSHPLRPSNRKTVTLCAVTPPPVPSPPATVETPVHRRLPLIGFFVDMFVRKTTNADLTRRYGDVYKSDVLGFPVTIISDLDAISACYKNTDVFRSEGAFPPSLATIFGENALFIIDGQRHSQKRKPVLPAFSPQLFPLYFSSIQEDSVAFWRKISENVNVEGKMKLSTAVKDHYLGIIPRLTSGEDVPSSTDTDNQYSRMAILLQDAVVGLFTLPFGPKWRRALNARDELLDCLAQLTRDRLATRATTIESLRSGGADRVASNARADLRAGSLDLLTVLIASTSLPTGRAEVLDRDVLRELGELVLLLWFAGYSTQAGSTLCCLMELGFNEDIQERLRVEQDTIVVSYGGAREVTIDQVNKEMPLLDSFITEILRMYPAAPVLFRKTSTDTMVCGHKIDKGTIVGLDTWGGQRNAKYYPDPDVLHIDRFLINEENGKAGAPQPPSIVSFGAVGGAHFCLGAALARVSMKSTLSTLLRDFELVLDAKQDRTYASIPDVSPRSGVEIISCTARNMPVVDNRVASGAESE